jgi:DNA-binding response OmpR family regulator
MNSEMNLSGNILVADDEQVNVEFFQVMLTKLGFTVETAFSGEEVLEKLKNFTPDLIILDLIMPKMSGYQVAKLLKKDDSTNEIPIIILTAVSDIREKVDMLELGIEDYIMKPFNFIEILARIRSVLRVGALREELKEYERKLDFIRKFQESLHLFLENVQESSLSVIKTGEKELKGSKVASKADEKLKLYNRFTQNVIDMQKTQLEKIEDMKCRYRELVEIVST